SQRPYCPPSFTHSNPDPRDPHSFPTRRSSDLDGLQHEQEQRDADPSIRRPEDPADRSRDARAHVIEEEIQRRRLRGALAGADAEDRKSTRLNSSHLGIAYAVFCLKKKNKSMDN